MSTKECINDSNIDSLLTQDKINTFYSKALPRRKNRNQSYSRLLHNHDLYATINEYKEYSNDTF